MSAARRVPRLLAVGAGTVAAVARALWARHLVRTTSGHPPGVRAGDGTLLHTQVEDPGGASVTVVLAHGFAARLEAFDPQREALRDQVRLVLYDQRGHGRSGWNGPRQATIERLGRDLGCVVDAAGDRPVVAVGHSMGGMGVLALARQRPELFGHRIVGVALLSTSAGRLAHTRLPPALARISLRTGIGHASLWLVWFVAPLLDIAGPFRTRLGRRWLRHRLFGPVPPPPHVLSKMEGMWTAMSQSMAAAFYPAMVSYHQASALDVLRRVPTLVLTGAADASIPARHSDRMAKAIGSGARLVTVAGAGHMVTMTHAAAVNTALAELLSEVERSSAAVPTVACMTSGQRHGASRGTETP